MGPFLVTRGGFTPNLRRRARSSPPPLLAVTPPLILHTDHKELRVFSPSPLPPHNASHCCLPSGSQEQFRRLPSTLCRLWVVGPRVGSGSHATPDARLMGPVAPTSCAAFLSVLLIRRTLVSSAPG